MIDLETRPQTKEQLSNRELHAILDYASDKVLDVATEDYYFDSVDRISGFRPDLPSEEVQALVLANYAKAYLCVNPMDESKAAALLMYCALPNFIIQTNKLDQARIQHHEDPLALKSVSNFNGLIRDFVSLHSETGTTLLRDRLAEGFENSTIRYKKPVATKGVEPFSPDHAITTTIAGVRSEVGFEQWLEASGVPYERTDNRDYTEGVDYEIQFEGQYIDVDLKTSALGAKAYDSLYRIQRGRKGRSDKVILVCPVRASDFVNDSFKLCPKSQAAAPDQAHKLFSIVANDLH